jgi:putative ABC transport system substrate-binding protein
MTMWRTTMTLLLSLVLSVLVAPHATEAQGRRHMPLVGVLEPNPSTTNCFKVFQQGLRDLGYVEGQHVTFVYRYADNQPDRLPTLAAELVRLTPEVIWTHSNPPAQAAKRATTTIPIVVGVGNELVEQGLAESMAQPGGNLTGLDLRRLELLKEAVPTISRVAVLVDPTNLLYTEVPHNIASEARAFGVQLQRVEASGPETFAGAFAAMVQGAADALMLPEGPPFGSHMPRLLELALEHRLPTMCSNSRS